MHTRYHEHDAPYTCVYYTCTKVVVVFYNVGDIVSASTAVLDDRGRKAGLDDFFGYTLVRFLRPSYLL